VRKYLENTNPHMKRSREYKLNQDVLLRREMLSQMDYILFSAKSPPTKILKLIGGLFSRII
jgi:hypothetical protein